MDEAITSFSQSVYVAHLILKMVIFTDLFFHHICFQLLVVRIEMLRFQNGQFLTKLVEYVNINYPVFSTFTFT